MDTFGACAMKPARPNLESVHAPHERGDRGGPGHPGYLEHELDRRENLERSIGDVRGVDAYVFLLLIMAALILAGVIVIVII